jgi:hypothetical protein
MKHKTWFRLVVKAIGILLFGLGLRDVADLVIGMLYYWDSASSTASTWQIVLSTLPQVLQALLGVYLFFGGDWIVNKVIPSNRPYCPECGYDLSHNLGTKCVECGIILPSDLYDGRSGAASDVAARPSNSA